MTVLIILTVDSQNYVAFNFMAFRFMSSSSYSAEIFIIFNEIIHSLFTIMCVETVLHVQFFDRGVVKIKSIKSSYNNRFKQIKLCPRCT